MWINYLSSACAFWTLFPFLLKRNHFILFCEFITPSRSWSSDDNFSQFTDECSSSVINIRFRIPLSLSQKPPHHGAEGSINAYSKRKNAFTVFIFSKSVVSNKLCDPMKLVLLSEYISEEWSLLATNPVSLRIKLAFEIVFKSCKWTFLKITHVTIKGDQVL